MGIRVIDFSNPLTMKLERERAFQWVVGHEKETGRAEMDFADWWDKWPGQYDPYMSALETYRAAGTPWREVIDQKAPRRVIRSNMNVVDHTYGIVDICRVSNDADHGYEEGDGWRLWLTESLLALARLDSGEAATTREPCDLDRIVRDATELLLPLAQEQTVSLEVESTPTRCEGDSEQLGQVVTNLVSNAISYNRPGGSVQVKVTAEPGVAVVAVSDTGLGIAPEDLPHLFERFYRADKARSSAEGRTGLGLSISKAIVEAHGGSIEVATDLGRGSTFTVRLPHPPRPPESSQALK